jgi:hypothetical protein
LKDKIGIVSNKKPDVLAIIGEKYSDFVRDIAIYPNKTIITFLEDCGRI